MNKSELVEARAMAKRLRNFGSAMAEKSYSQAANIIDALLAERKTQAQAWAEGYGTGAHDQSIAAEQPLGYWQEPARVNPYE